MDIRSLGTYLKCADKQTLGSSALICNVPMMAFDTIGKEVHQTCWGPLLKLHGLRELRSNLGELGHDQRWNHPCSRHGLRLLPGNLKRWCDATSPSSTDEPSNLVDEG